MAGEPDAEERLTAPQQPDLAGTLEALRNWNGAMPAPAIFYGLSDLDAAGLARYEPVWQSLPAGRRVALLRHLTDAGESNLDLDYRAPGMLALRDGSAAVRQAAIELLWEDDSRALLRRLLELLREDEALAVRSAAAGALGRFVLAGELGRLASDEYLELLAALETIWRERREDVDLRRRVLESLSNSSAEIVPAAIREAWASDADEMRTSAMYAMGRSCDPRWEEVVLNALDDDDAVLRFEAVRASGELELVAALPALARLLQDGDEEIAEAAIQALGEIGGPRAQELLGALAEDARDAGDEALLEVVEDALGVASLERFGRDQDAGD